VVTKEALLEIALKCRAEILSVPAKERHILFQTFPKGACGGASEKLGQIVADTFNCQVQYVFARRRWGKFMSHAWITVNGLIVDITADQFKDGPPVFIGPIVAYEKEWEIEGSWEIRPSVLL
jgi:hypothetical protein